MNDDNELGGTLKTMIRMVALALVTLLSASCYAQNHPGAEAFAQRVAAEHQMDADAVLRLLQQGRFKQSIVDAITRPAEAKPWYEYRKIFLTDQRIGGGAAFWSENEERIERAAAELGVDPQIIVAIIGVETFYGRITGSYRVLDALVTLAFYYPDTGNDRSAFFSSELMNFIVLGDEEGLPLEDVTGSYAGAMGLGQFMPSSYREYAVDLDADGRRDLWSSMDDIIGSVANYLRRHGWQAGEPIVYPLTAHTSADRGKIATRDFRPAHRMADLRAAGFVPATTIDDDVLGTVVRLEEPDGESLWLAFENFYVITRYNRSPLYAMAVYELSEAILRERADAR